ncbi:hypothetical protein AYO44_00665 [Planctomycetaceae bacterium SCGC AG-212-F19]|nr:hypothetical protein AYO44_00665 [Planctomycetaceae bacterium SCGC AG-212-F19]
MDEFQVGPPQRRHDEAECAEVPDFALRKSALANPGNVVGLISLLTCITGVIVPLGLLALLESIKPVGGTAYPFPFSLLLFVLCQMLAFLCGALAARTIAGKAGMIGSLVCMSPIIFWLRFWAYTKVLRYL